MQDSRNFINSNKKVLYNSRYSNVEENKNPELIYYRLQNLESKANFYILS